MATERTIKRNDTSPSLVITCLDGAVAKDLTGATSARFLMGTIDSAGTSTAKVDASATITDAVNGVVTYDWVATDTDTVGEYKAEVEITWSDDTKQTFPNDDYLIIKVVADLA